MVAANAEIDRMQEELTQMQPLLEANRVLHGQCFPVEDCQKKAQIEPAWNFSAAGLKRAGWLDSVTPQSLGGWVP